MMKVKSRRKPLSLSKRIKQIDKLMRKPREKGIACKATIYIEPGKYTEDITLVDNVFLIGMK